MGSEQFEAGELPQVGGNGQSLSINDLDVDLRRDRVPGKSSGSGDLRSLLKDNFPHLEPGWNDPRLNPDVPIPTTGWGYGGGFSRDYDHLEPGWNDPRLKINDRNGDRHRFEPHGSIEPGNVIKDLQDLKPWYMREEPFSFKGGDDQPILGKISGWVHGGGFDKPTPLMNLTGDGLGDVPDDIRGFLAAGDRLDPIHASDPIIKDQFDNLAKDIKQMEDLGQTVVGWLDRYPPIPIYGPKPPENPYVKSGPPPGMVITGWLDVYPPKPIYGPKPDPNVRAV